MNTFGKLIDIFIATIVCFFFPLIYFAQKQDLLIQLLAYDMAKDLVHTVQVQGELTQTVYDSFLSRLSAVTGSLDVTLLHEQHVYEPVYEWTSGTHLFSGEVMEYSNQIGTSDILDTIYETGRYRFEKGDYFQITLVNRADTLAGTLLHILYLGIPDEQIQIFYGGKIRDSD